jgi:hypothetical protein
MKAITVRSFSVALGMMALAGAAYAQSDDVPSPCASVSDDKSRLQCYDAQEKLRKGRSQASSATEPSSPPAQPSAATAVATPPAQVASGELAPAPAQASTPPVPRQAPIAATASAAVEPGAASEAGTPAPQAPVAKADSNEFGLTSEALRKKRAAESTEPEEQQQVGRVKSVKGLRKGDYRIELENGQIWMETQRTGGDPPEVGETVTIRRASLGSYFLSRQAGLALRVKRIQ